MRFMMIVRATERTETGEMPGEELIDAMTRYNEEMMRAGIVRDLDGLHPSSEGVRISFSGNEVIAQNGPFPHQELIAGYWLIEVPSLDEAIEWGKRAPFGMDGSDASTIEIRQLFELEEFPESEALDRARELETEFARSRD